MQQNFKTYKLSDKYLHLLILSGIIILTLIVYSGTYRNGFTNLDDNVKIIQNKGIRDFSVSGIAKIFSSIYNIAYQPLTFVVFSIVYKFFVLNPTAYHTINILFHILNIVLVYFFIYHLTGPHFIFQSQLNSNKRILLSTIIACFFAVHPMNTEPISWIGGFDNCLYSFCYLASIIYYVKYLKQSTVSTQQLTVNNQKSIFYLNRNYVFSLLLFLLSLLSKPMAITLPVILILLDYYSCRSFNIKIMIDKIPFILLALGSGIITIITEVITITNNTNVVLSNFSLFNRFFLSTYSLSFYIIRFILPFKLTAMYPPPDIVNGILPIEYYISPLLIIIIIAIILKTKNARKEIIFGTLFFIITISVALIASKIRYYQQADRYTYIPYIGLYFIIAILVSQQSTVNSQQKKSKIQNIKFLIIIIFILFFSLISYNRNKVWVNGLTLFDDVLEKFPNACLPYCYRGDAKASLGDSQGALQDYNKAIEINPQLAQAFNNRGLLKFQLGDKPGAIQDYNKAIEIKPGLALSVYNRDLAKASLGYRQGTLLDYNKAIELNPEDEQALLNRGHIKASLGDMQGAIQDFNRAIENNPQSAEAYNNRGNAKASLNDMKGAIEDYNKVINLSPTYAYAFINRGHAKYILGYKKDACSDWRKAVELGKTEANDLINKYCN
jgi:protein O-mannosyl-transferase